MGVCCEVGVCSGLYDSTLKINFVVFGQPFLYELSILKIAQAFMCWSRVGHGHMMMQNTKL